ncbi:MAG: glycosyltransferase family 4 protein [Gammaproteobacteria bacterium]
MSSVAELCLSPNQGGLELYFAALIRRLSQRGDVKVHAIIARDAFLTENVVHEALIIKRPNPLRLPGTAKALAREIDALGVDVLHIHWGFDLPLAVLTKRASKRPLKLIYSRHMHITRAKHDFYHRFLYRHVDLMLVTTKRMQYDAQGYLPLSHENIRLLHLGVTALSADQVETRSALGLSDNVFTIGAFSRIEPGKGQHVLLEALRLLHHEGVRFEAAFIGHVMDRGYYEDLKTKTAESGLGDRIAFREFVPDPMRYMPCFDAVVLTTFGETFGLVLVEAMTMGVAVVGTNAGGVPETIEHEHSGLLFEPGNSRALADALERLYEDMAFRNKLARQGQLRARKKFSEERHYERLSSVLQDLS